MLFKIEFKNKDGSIFLNSKTNNDYNGTLFSFKFRSKESLEQLFLISLEI